MNKHTIISILVMGAGVFVGQWAYAQYIKSTTNT